MKYMIIFGLMGLLLGGFSGYIMITQEVQLNGELVDCYDMFRNKIEDQTCIVEGSYDNKEYALIMRIISSFLFTTLFVVILGFMGYIFDGFENINKPYGERRY
jgi:hypothetical protein